MSIKTEMNNWLPVFDDDSLNQTLKDDGIVKIKLDGFDTDAAKNFLKNTVDGYPEQFNAPFYGSYNEHRLEIKKKVHSGLSNFLDPFINSLLADHRTLCYFFIVKGNGGNSRVNLHQDWSIVDELKHRAYTLWIPLVDSTIDNGTLHVLKGSHLFPLNIRGGAILPKFEFANEADAKALNFLSPITVKAGEALIFDSRILHYSPSNQSALPRTSIISNITPTQAESFCFTQEETDGKQDVYRYTVPHDFYMLYDDLIRDKDVPNALGTNRIKIDYANIEQLNFDEFKRLTKEYLRPKKKWFFF